MELMLHYVWKHKIFPLHKLTTTDGKRVEVINPGTHNTNAGPDFINALIKIDDITWSGNIELHLKSSDWNKHHHDTNPDYNSVILHVTTENDCDIVCCNGNRPPHLILDIPDYVMQNYEQLKDNDKIPPCSNILNDIPLITTHSWLSALFIERLEEKTHQINERRDLSDKNWEDAFFVTIARNFGFGINGNAFEKWAYSIPMNALAKHRDNLFQIEAIFFGQAGLLNNKINDSKQKQDDEYFVRLQSEYNYLKQKFSLTPIDPIIWRFLRLRPQNFPHIRIAQLAMMYHEGKLNMSRVIEACDLSSLYSLIDTKVSDYWRTHYTFCSSESENNHKKLSISSKNLLVINSFIPIMFAYGEYKSDEELKEKAIKLMNEIPAENNHFIRDWKNAGIICSSAADSQALLQLTNKYCSKHDCLRCRFGYEYIRNNPGFLKEKQNEPN